MLEPFVLLRSRAAAKSTFLAREGVTLYQLLGVSPGACDEPDLREARNGLLRMFHPDRNPEDRRAADFAARANAAYTTLSDHAARRLYDASLRSTHVHCADCDGLGFKARTRGFSVSVQRLRCKACGGFGWVLKGAKK